MPNYSQDIVSEQGIRSFMATSEPCTITYYNQVDSTNTVLVESIRKADPHSIVVAIAETQTAGKGRRGKTFASPAGTGLYLSIGLPVTIAENLIVRSTMATCVAVFRAIEEVIGCSCFVKWPNDIYVGNRKVCGMLSERVVASDTSQAYFVSGSGINVYEPVGGFPEELSQTAGTLLESPNSNIRNRLAARIIDESIDLQSVDDEVIYRAYTDACQIEGRHINIIESDGSCKPATALEILFDGRLNVELETGDQVALQSDQVSIRLD